MSVGLSLLDLIEECIRPRAEDVDKRLTNDDPTENEGGKHA